MLILLLFIHAPFSSSTSTPYFTKLDLFHRKTMSTENAPVLLQAAAKQDKSSGLAAEIQRHSLPIRPIPPTARAITASTGREDSSGSTRGVMGTETFTIGTSKVTANQMVVSSLALKLQSKLKQFSPHQFFPTLLSLPLYYVSLQGITVGGTLLSIPKNTFELNKDGTGGMIIGSGNVFPRLEKTAFQLVKQEFKSQLNLAFADRSDSGFDACFSIPSGHTLESVPKLVYHFDGADLQLHRSDNYLAFDKKDVLCLMILESRDGLSIFGNIHQQNMQMHFDLQKEVVSFVPDVQCDEI
ncbi:hypothetical protein J5N97_004969 [Dioscorea zingiberensis]|uniref:Peptidase A1 domain-containing protein n=1 Tax=Dioscorea zingiberensis TaxID=325984 RepID=A0A9D5HRT6_9LILI|nr:hypothetical protein J5N97_004969 [Dioscorea zingiberensis]